MKKLLCLVVFLPFSLLQVSLNTTSVFRNVDEDFLSVTIDIGSVRSNFSYINPKYNQESTRVTSLAKALAPVLVRVGGTTGDFVIFNDLHGRVVPSDIQGRYDVMMSPEVFDTLMGFVNEAGWRMIFGLNQLLRYPNNQWDCSNAELLIEYCMKKGYNVAWELGNEPDCYSEDKFTSVLNGTQGAQGMKILREVITKKRYPVTLLAGPDVAVLERVDYLSQYLAAIQDTINSTTWHHYYGNGAIMQLKDFYSVEELDKLIEQIDTLLQICNATGFEGDLWIGETSSAYGGGSPLYSSSFVSGFMWLDKLGVAAYTHKKVFRQDFVGAKYSLISKSGYPYPDYWLSLLYKKLVSAKVIEVQDALTLGRGIRIYAHCAKPPYPSGSVVLLILNVYNETAKVQLKNKELSTSAQDIYWLTPHPRTNITSRVVALNGRPLYLEANDTLPPLMPVTHQTPSLSIIVEYLSFGFIVFKEANVNACL